MRLSTVHFAALTNRVKNQLEVAELQQRMTPISVAVLFLGLMIAIPGTNQIVTYPTITCDTDFTDLTYSITPLICPGECWRQYDRNQLCGLDKYSGGSICLAAMQLGLIDDVVGGFVIVYKNMNVSFKPVGGSRNGVTSHNCSRSKVSYTFDITCDTNGNAKQALNKALCPSGCGGGLVLGSDPYHVNSSVCSAAVHAGKVTRENGGEVTIYKLHDVRSNLNGSLRNGVKSVGSSRSSVNIFTFGFFDECKLPTKVCQNNATCDDLKYGFVCSCTPGFQGRICDTDINECGHAGSCDANAVCYNTKGSFICTCNTGYSGDGKICTAFYCDFAPTVSNGGSVTPTLPAPPGYHGNTVVTSSCATGFESTSGSKTSECSATNTWTPASLNCTACYAGVKDGRVKDAQMTASNSRIGYPPSKGRLDGPSAWLTKYGRFGEWLQVNFLGNKTIYGVVTQGDGRGRGYWTSKFEIKYSSDGTNFLSIKEGSTPKIFDDNVDTNSHKINRFPTPITAQYFRLVSQSSTNSYLRLEYLTC